MAIYILALLVLAYALSMWWFWWRPLMAIGFAIAAMTVAVGSTASYAHAHRAMAKSVVEAPQSAPVQQVRLRYYGGPKSPMYP
jgi:hypothetical protein